MAFIYTECTLHLLCLHARQVVLFLYPAVKVTQILYGKGKRKVKYNNRIDVHMDAGTGCCL